MSMNRQFYNGNGTNPSPTTPMPTIAPTKPVISPGKEKDPSRTPYKRPEADPRPKA
jgi:hypothetical protein